MTSSLDGGSLQFMGHEFTVWDKSFGDPRRQLNTSETSSKGKFDGKLVGRYSLPFSFPFPTHVDLLTKSVILSSIGSSVHTLPHACEFGATDMFPSSPGTIAEIATMKKKRRSSWTFGFISGSPETNESSSSDRHRRKTSYCASRQPANWTALRTTASPIPQTFMERGNAASVAYEISALFVHGKFKFDSRQVI